MLLSLMLTFGPGPPIGVRHPAAAAPRFLPPTYSRGDQTTMVIRIPDGRGFLLSYSKVLHLSGFDLTTSGQVGWPVDSGIAACCDRVMAPYYGTVASLFTGSPLGSYRGSRGQRILYGVFKG